MYLGICCYAYCMNKKLAQAFAHCAHQAASADNSQPWIFSWNADGFVIAYDTARVKDNTFPPLNPATLLAIGGCLENIETFAAASNLGITCTFPLSEREGRFEFVRISLRPTGDNAESIPVPNFCRHTNRHPFYSTPVSPAVLKRITSRIRGTSRVQALIDAADLAILREAVHNASEIRFQTREVHEWLGKSLRFDHQRNAHDGLDVRTLALPPGGVQLLRFIRDWDRMALLNKLGFYKVLSAVDSAPVGKGPALIAIIGGTGTMEVIDSGQLLNAVWTDLNRQGLAVHPYYVIPDLLYRLREGQVPPTLQAQAESVKSATSRLLSLGEGETLHMLLRVGHPTRRCIPSQRLPMDVVFPEAYKSDVTLLE